MWQHNFFQFFFFSLLRLIIHLYVAWSKIMLRILKLIVRDDVELIKIRLYVTFPVILVWWMEFKKSAIYKKQCYRDENIIFDCDFSHDFFTLSIFHYIFRLVRRELHNFSKNRWILQHNKQWPLHHISANFNSSVRRLCKKSSLWHKLCVGHANFSRRLFGLFPRNSLATWPTLGWNIDFMGVSVVCLSIHNTQILA